MTLITPLPEILPFTWHQRMVRGWFALIDTLSERLIHRTPDHISTCIIFLGMSLVAAPFLLGAATMIHMVVTTRTNGWMMLGFVVAAAISGGLRSWWKRRPGLDNLGPLNYLQYAMLQAIGETHPVWREQIIGWAMETPELDDRHWRAARDGWIRASLDLSTLQASTRHFTGSNGLDLFEGEGRKRALAIGQAWSRKMALEAMADAQPETVTGRKM